LFERLKKVKCPTVWAWPPPWQLLVGCGTLFGGCGGAPRLPSTAYSPDHNDVGDGEEDDLPEGAPEVVDTGGLSATRWR
jgi:hypothetical protein